MASRTAPNTIADDEVIELTDVIEKGTVKKKPVATDADVAMGGEDVDTSFEQELEDLFSDAGDYASAGPSGKAPSMKDSEDLDEFEDLFGEATETQGPEGGPAAPQAGKASSADVGEEDFDLEGLDFSGFEESEKDYEISLEDTMESPSAKKAAPSAQEDIDDLFADLGDLGGLDMAEEAPPTKKGGKAAPAPAAKAPAPGKAEAAPSAQDDIDDLFADLGDFGDLDMAEEAPPVKKGGKAAPAPAAKAPAPGKAEAAPSAQDDIDDLFADLGDLGGLDMAEEAPPAKKGGKAAPAPAAKAPAPGKAEAAPSAQDDIDDLFADLGDFGDLDMAEEAPPVKKGGKAAPAPAAKAPAPGKAEAAPSAQDDIDDLFADLGDLGGLDMAEEAPPAKKGGKAAPAPAPAAKAPAPGKAEAAPSAQDDIDDLFADLGDLGVDMAEEAPPAAAQGEERVAPAQKPAKVTASQDDIDDLLGDMDLSDKSEQTMVGFGEDLLNQIDDDDDTPVAPREKVAVAAPAPQQVRDHDATMEFEVLEGQEKPAGATGPGGAEADSMLDDFDLDSLEAEIGGDFLAESSLEKETAVEEQAGGEIDFSDFDLDEPTEIVPVSEEGEVSSPRADDETFDFGVVDEGTLSGDMGGFSAEVTQEIDLTADAGAKLHEGEASDEIDFTGLDQLIDGLDLPEDHEASAPASGTGEAAQVGGAEEYSEEGVKLDDRDLEDLDAILQDIDEEETEASASDDDAELEIGEQDLDAIESAYREGELLDEDEEGVEVEEGFEAEFEAGELFEAPGDTARPPQVELPDSGKEDTLAEFTLAEEPVPDVVLQDYMDLESMDGEQFERQIEAAAQRESAVADEEHALGVGELQEELEAVHARLAELESKLLEAQAPDMDAPVREAVDHALAAALPAALEERTGSLLEQLRQSVRDQVQEKVSEAVEERSRELLEQVEQSVRRRLEEALPGASASIADDVFARVRQDMEQRSEQQASALLDALEQRIVEKFGPDTPLMERIRDILVPEMENVVHEGLLPFRSETLTEAGLEKRLHGLEESVEQRIARAVPQAAARIIREEIANLAQELI